MEGKTEKRFAGWVVAYPTGQGTEVLYLSYGAKVDTLVCGLDLATTFGDEDEAKAAASASSADKSVKWATYSVLPVWRESRLVLGRPEDRAKAPERYRGILRGWYDSLKSRLFELGMAAALFASAVVLLLWFCWAAQWARTVSRGY